MVYTNDQLAHRFELTVDEQLVAWIDYELADGILALNHTEVVPAFRGRGFAGDLVTFALIHAQLQHVRVAANCTFVATFIESHAGYEGLVA
jgi:hypothetical protein